MICDYCHRDVEQTWPLLDFDSVDHICRDCLNDVRHAASGGKIAQNPGDEP